MLISGSFHDMHPRNPNESGLIMFDKFCVPSMSNPLQSPEFLARLDYLGSTSPNRGTDVFHCLGCANLQAKNQMSTREGDSVCGFDVGLMLVFGRPAHSTRCLLSTNLFAFVRPVVSFFCLKTLDPSKENKLIAGWWFGTFLFSHILGIIIPIDSYFSEGWPNHQPDCICSWLHLFNCCGCYFSTRRRMVARVFTPPESWGKPCPSMCLAKHRSANMEGKKRSWRRHPSDLEILDEKFDIAYSYIIYDTYDTLTYRYLYIYICIHMTRCKLCHLLDWYAPFSQRAR